MSLKKHLRRFHTEVMICARCECEYTFSKSDYNFYKTKQAILKANGWREFSDKSKPYLLCEDCSFFRKYNGLLFSIDNVLQTITSYHCLKEVKDDHNAEVCELCLAIRRTTFVTKDFKDYLTSKPSFFYLEKPPKKSSFDDSYGVVSDAEIVMSQKASALSVSATSHRKGPKGQNQLKQIAQVSGTLPNLPKLSNSFIHINATPKILLDESNRKATETDEAKVTEISNNSNAISILETLTEQVVSEQVVRDEELINLSDGDNDIDWLLTPIDDDAQDITISNWDDNLLTQEKEIESQVIPNSLLNEISDNAHDQPTNGQQALLHTQKSKHKFCLPKRPTANNPSSKVNSSIWSYLVQTLSLPLMLLSSIVLGMFLLLLSFVVIHMFSQS